MGVAGLTGLDVEERAKGEAYAYKAQLFIRCCCHSVHMEPVRMYVHLLSIYYLRYEF